MKCYDPTYLQVFEKTEEPFKVPKLDLERLDVRCFHCGNHTLIPVPPTYIDWEKIAEKYRKICQEIVLEQEQMVRDLDAMGASEEVVNYLQNQFIIKIENLLKRAFRK